MGGALISIKDSSLSRLKVCWCLIDAALVLLIFGEVEIVIPGASVKSSKTDSSAKIMR